MNRYLFLVFAALIGFAATPPAPTIGVPGGDPRRTNSPPVPLRIIWGNYIWPDRPAKPPVFKDTDFTAFGGRFVDRQTTNTTKRAGKYAFLARNDARQVMWLPDALGPPTFSVSGFPWSLTPAPNTALQTLSLAGVPGKVYFTSQQNSGGYSITSNPVIIK